MYFESIYRRSTRASHRVFIIVVTLHYFQPACVVAQHHRHRPLGFDFTNASTRIPVTTPRNATTCISFIILYEYDIKTLHTRGSLAACTHLNI